MMSEEFELSKILNDVSGVIELHLRALSESTNSVTKSDLDNTYIKNLQEEFLKLHREKYNLKTELLSQKKLFISEIDEKNKIITKLELKIKELQSQETSKNIILSVEELNDSDKEINSNIFISNNNKKVKNNVSYSELYNSCPIGYSSLNLNEEEEDVSDDEDDEDDEDSPMYNQFKSLAKFTHKINPFPKNSLSYINYESNPMFVDLNKAPEIWKKINKIPSDEIKKAYPNLNWSITDLHIIKLKNMEYNCSKSNEEDDEEDEDVNPFPPGCQAYKNYENGLNNPVITKAPYTWHTLNIVPSEKVKNAYPDLDWSITLKNQEVTECRTAEEDKDNKKQTHPFPMFRGLEGKISRRAEVFFY